MVLKRFLTMALGALGLGALAAGTALGQTAGDGNIPAPDIFDDQITCSMNVPSETPTPTVVPMGGMTSPLDDLIGMGDMAIGALGGVGDLGYVIPPMGANCGAGVGTDLTPFNAVTVGMGPVGDTPATADYNLGEGDIATDVAHGYSDLLTKFVAVYGHPEGTTGGTARALQTAQKMLGDAIEAGQTGAASLTPLETAVTRAQEAHDKARAAFTDASAGPIYQAGVAEWMAKASVTKSIADYDEAVGKANNAREELDALSYANYVPLGNNELTAGGTPVVTIANGMASVNLNQLIQYANADLNIPQVATVSEVEGEEGTTTTTNSNFDAAGRLIVPMSYQNTDNDADTDEVLASIKDPMNVSVVRTARDNTELAAAALEKLRDDNLNPALATVYSEAARRARAEADYYAGVYTAMLGDTTNLNVDADGVPNVDIEGTADVDESTPFSIASRNSEFQTEDNKRFLAEQTLRGAVRAREDATAGVRAAFTTPQSFYEQLVARRQALKVAADRKVAAAAEDGGTVPMNVTEAATAAAEALADAEEVQASIAGLYDDPEDPTTALVATLLETGGDDGKALVDAIAGTYDTAKEAKATADETAGMISGLTGDDGAVSMNTAAITENSDNITALDGRVTQNEDDIDALDGRVTVNEGAIMTNAGNIATNSTNIMANRTDIDANIANIATNTAGIATNTGDIMTNAGHIMENRGMIEMNTAGVSSNADAIGSNERNIMENSRSIGELSKSLDVVRAGVAASMALAGMPAINGRGISIGVGSFDGESAFAVGFQIQGEMASFKVGLTSGGGATGASAGVGFQF